MYNSLFKMTQYILVLKYEDVNKIHSQNFT